MGMMTAELLTTLSMLVGAISATYLLARLTTVIVRVRRARQAYPRPSIGRDDLANEAPTSVANAEREDRYCAVLLGVAAGDALGLPAESLPRWLIRLRYPSGPRLRRGYLRLTRRAGDVSDDTQLTLAVARAIDDHGRYQHARFRAELARFTRHHVGAGRATLGAARRLARDPDALAVGEPSEGNGAAMRVAALALLRADEIEPRRLLDEVRLNAECTHTPSLAVASAVLVALLLRALLREPAGRSLSRETLRELTALSAFPLPLVDAVLDAPDLERALEVSGTSGHAPSTVAAAIALLVHMPRDPRPALRLLFFRGGDLDTIGSIALALHGARWGTAGLPSDWTDRLQYRGTLRAEAGRLARLASRSAQLQDG